MKSQSLRIAIIGQQGIPARYGGVERVAEELGAGLVERGHQVTAFNTARMKRHQRMSSHRGIRLLHLPSSAGKATGNLSLSLASTLRVIAKNDFDIAHFHAIGPSALSGLIPQRSSVASVATLHGRDDQRSRWGGLAKTLLTRAAPLAVAKPDGLISVSSVLADDIEASFGRRPTVITNGVIPPADPGAVYRSRFLPSVGLQPGKFLVAVGRLVPEKALDDLLSAMERSPGLDVNVAIVGAARHDDEFALDIMNRADTDPRITVLGARFGEQLGALYHGAAGFVTASHLEGMPLTVLEAAAIGLPVLASDIGPHREILGSDAPGRRFFAATNVDSLVERLASFATNLDAEQAAAQANAPALQAEHTWERVVDRTIDVYREARAKKATRSNTVPPIDLRDRREIQEVSPKERTPQVTKQA